MRGGSSSRKRGEQTQQQPSTIEEEEEEDDKMYEVEEGEEEEEDEEEDDEEDEENNHPHQEEERPKLAEGFFEIEAVRGKRTRKGKRQYLIKWRGWPETANTWEPFDNLQSCSDIIQAFEQRSAKTSRKRKRKHTTTATTTAQTQPPKKKQHQPDPLETPDTTHYNHDPPLQEGPPDDDAATLSHLTHTTFTDFHIPLEQTNQPDPLFSQLTAPLPPPTLSDNANISLQVPQTAPDTSARFTGAKRRKSGRVRRFKQDSLPPALHHTPPSIPQITNAPTSLLLEPFANDVDCFQNPSAIIKIVKPIAYSASLSNDVHDVSLIFRAIRSDGGETEVDNNYLKVHNPLLLISYYEQHLRYTPPPT